MKLIWGWIVGVLTWFKTKLGLVKEPQVPAGRVPFPTGKTVQDNTDFVINPSYSILAYESEDELWDQNKLAADMMEAEATQAAVDAQRKFLESLLKTKDDIKVEVTEQDGALKLTAAVLEPVGTPEHTKLYVKNQIRLAEIEAKSTPKKTSRKTKKSNNRKGKKK